MAEGCNLYFTEKDLIDVEESINNLKVNISPSKFASNALSAIIQRSPNSIIKSLQDSNDSKNELLKGLIFTSLNANKLHSSDKEKLIDSLIVVLKYEKNPIGLFSNPPKYRGPGADSMKHGGELLTIGAIINNSDLEDPINPKLGFTSLSGKNLFYNYKTDKVAFGQKFASNYSLSTRKKGTIEADTLISREIKDDFLGSTFSNIAIDTKYSIHSDYNSTKDLNRQLQGIRNSFNDGQIDEFYFVSNVKFGNSFKTKVENCNNQIVADTIANNPSLNKYCNDMDVIQDYNKIKIIAGNLKIEIPQVDICEYV